MRILTHIGLWVGGACLGWALGASGVCAQTPVDPFSSQGWATADEARARAEYWASVERGREEQEARKARQQAEVEFQRQALARSSSLDGVPPLSLPGRPAFEPTLPDFYTGPRGLAQPWERGQAGPNERGLAVCQTWQRCPR